MPTTRAGEHLLGLIAEQVTRVIRRERGEFHETGLRLGQAPYLGPVLLDEHGMVQWCAKKNCCRTTCATRCSRKRRRFDVLR